MTHRGTWKNAERRVAKAFGGTRSGATGFKSNDVKGVEGLALEVKYRTQLPAFLVKTLRQAETAHGASGRVPVAVFLERGMQLNDGIVAIRFRDFQYLLEQDSTSESVSVSVASASLDASHPPAPTEPGSSFGGDHK